MNLPLISQKNTLFDNLLFNDLLFAEINVQYKSRLALGFFRVVSAGGEDCVPGQRPSKSPLKGDLKAGEDACVPGRHGEFSKFPTTKVLLFCRIRKFSCKRFAYPAKFD